MPMGERLRQNLNSRRQLQGFAIPVLWTTSPTQHKLLTVISILFPALSNVGLTEYYEQVSMVHVNMFIVVRVFLSLNMSQ